MVESRVRRRLHPVRLRLKDSTRDVVRSSSHRSHSYGNLLLEKRHRLREKGRGSTWGGDPGAPRLRKGNRWLGVGSSRRKGRLLGCRGN